MNNQEINALIGEACGWRPSVDGGICWGPDGEAIITPPNYCRDLNAMHDAEQHLFNGPEYDSRYEFVSHLARILNPVHGYRMTDGVDLLDASARQRAEAFLRTIGKWKEEE